MPAKRGRPLSNPDPNPQIQLRREQARARQQARAQRLRLAKAAAVPSTVEQDRQRDLVLQRPFAQEDVPPTLVELGLRVQGLRLDQDPDEAELQQRLVAVEDHQTLYHDREFTNNEATENSQSRLNSFTAKPPQFFSVDTNYPHRRSSPTTFEPRLPSSPLISDFNFNWSDSDQEDEQENNIQLQSRGRINWGYNNQESEQENNIQLQSRDGVNWSDGEQESEQAQRQNRPSSQSSSATDDTESDVENGWELLRQILQPTVADGEENGEDENDNEGRERKDKKDEKDERKDDDSPHRHPRFTPIRNEQNEEERPFQRPPSAEHEWNGPDNHTEDEDYSFQSERSSGETPEIPLSPLEFTTQKLFEMLQDGFHGCLAEKHTAAVQRHVARYGDNCHGLAFFFNDHTFPSVLAQPDFTTLPRLQRQHHPTPQQWANVFCGIPVAGQDSRPRQLCLDREETHEVPPDVAFDVDSFLFFTSSLAAARQGLHYQPAPQVRQNMQTDVHIQTAVFESHRDPDLPPRRKMMMLKDVPHFYLGRVEGASDISIHILFPHLPHRSDTFVGLTDEQHACWLDRIFHPAVYHEYRAHYTQHLPASHRHALAASKARQVEGRQIETTSYQAQLSLSYFLQPERLQDVWEAILQTITHTPDLHGFRDPQLFFSSKGTKLQFKTSPSRPTLLDTIDNFQTYFERIIDLQYVFLDRCYVDLGKEICASVGLLPDAHTAVDDEAQVYLWRQCCLRHHLQWLYDGVPPHSGHTYYHVSMLRDAGCLTSVPPKRSRLRAGGLLYSQFYNSVKETTDAAKSFPFQNEGLEELALDPQIRQSAHVAGGRPGRTDLHVLQKAYLASKRRMHVALTDSRHKSFGVREEHRVSWPLMLALRRRLALEPPDRLEVILVDCPSYVWPIRTAVYHDFVWRNVDKFATGFEVALARCARQFVTWEQTKIMAMFLRCLRYAVQSHDFAREAPLWWSRREIGDPAAPRVRYGLGYANTMARYGYAWIEPRIDFEQLVFHADVTDHVLFGNQVLRTRYLRHGGAVRDFHSNFVQLERAVSWLQRHHASPDVARRLVNWTVHLCLRQFRVDTLTAVAAELREEHRSAALEGLRPFSHLYLEDIMDYNGLHLVSGNKSAFKTPAVLTDMLFHYDDGRKRTHWENKPYRTLFQRACTTIGARPTTAAFVSVFKRRLTRWLLAFHWILPYPSVDVFTQTTKAGQRMWYSIQPVGREDNPLVDYPDRDPDQWEWAGKDWWPGEPPNLPRYLGWSTSQWEAWIERQ